MKEEVEVVDLEAEAKVADQEAVVVTLEAVEMTLEEVKISEVVAETSVEMILEEMTLVTNLKKAALVKVRGPEAEDCSQVGTLEAVVKVVEVVKEEWVEAVEWVEKVWEVQVEAIWMTLVAEKDLALKRKEGQAKEWAWVQTEETRKRQNSTRKITKTRSPTGMPRSKTGKPRETLSSSRCSRRMQIS